MHYLMSVRILVFVFLSLVIIPNGSSVSFNFTNFLNCGYIDSQYDAYCASNGLINLTAASQNSTGRATYKEPVLLWDKNSGEVTSFTTKFSFMIKKVKNVSIYTGDGFTFFLAPYPAPKPERSTIVGGYLGLFENTTALDATKNHIVAVEFDTYSNWLLPLDETSYDGCHTGIDINTVRSSSQMFMDFYSNRTIDQSSNAGCFFVDSNMTAQIEYNSGLKLLSLLLWRDNDPEIRYELNKTELDISTVLPNISTIGFSASTGFQYELHQIYSWSFESTLEVISAPPSSSPPSFHKDKSWSASTIGGVSVGVFLIIVLTGCMIYCLKQKRLIRNTKETELIDSRLIDYEFEKGKGPKKFIYSELVDATNGFAENNKLGEGGFGPVYRGILKNENIHVAVKRVSKESKQGQKEYIAEVKIISQLRHRNLVQLLGWCHDHGELLLVYELMHNGSLDTHLYNNKCLLTWPIRRNIALGLGQALLYLHEECELCVVHRDIKPSNLMLDSSFNSKLGDFGLARLTDHHRDLDTTVVAGTNGYMAPEYVLGTSNASTQSDVFSFGVVLLEIVCGRRPIVHQEDLKKVYLVEWVWGLYGENMLMEAVDGRLNGNFEREEVECFMKVGLWCAYPEKSLRPSIKLVMTVLQFQAPLPILPSKMPQPIYDAPIYPTIQFSEATSTSSGIAQTSTKSAPAQSSDSSCATTDPLH